MDDPIRCTRIVGTYETRERLHGPVIGLGPVYCLEDAVAVRDDRPLCPKHWLDETEAMPDGKKVPWPQ